MQNSTQNHKRIAKNTFVLYVRMFISMLIGLYTSRIILRTLGESDYGIYNVVGGMVAMLSFLNSAMTSASQRYIAFEISNGDSQKLNKVFCTSVNIHTLIAFFVLFIGETIGLWFVNAKLNIPIDRMYAANWVYQFSIFSFMISIMSVPYNACIVAHEHMKAFAYIGILEMILKLVIVFLLLLFPVDKLILYASFVLMVNVFIRACYVAYCKKHFNECHYKYSFDKNLFTNMLSFASWSLLGNLGISFKDQISNILLNIFCGTVVNAARGIAIQVSGIITTFSYNLSMAINPQITKQYAAGNIHESLQLIYSGAKYSFFLLIFVCVPFLINIDYILELWLGTVPKYTSIFIILCLLSSMIYTLSGTVSVGLQATGKIKIFQIGVCIIMLSELPIAYIFLSQGFLPYYALLPGIFTNIIALFFRFFLLKKLIPSSSFKYYTLNIVLRSIMIFIISWGICNYIHGFFPSASFMTVIYTTIISIIILALIIFFIGLSKNERLFVINKTYNLYQKKRIL